MILIIDIDETLIHSRRNTQSSTPLIDNDIDKNDLFHIRNYIVQKRPHLDLFLSKILTDDYYEVGIWSAGTHDYVHEIVNNIIPDKNRLRFVLTRNDCDEKHDKPLTKVRELIKHLDTSPSQDLLPYDRSIHDFIIIDDRDGVTGHDELNHLKIIEFEGDPIDSELLRLWEYLDAHRYYSSEYLVANWK